MERDALAMAAQCFMSALSVSDKDPAKQHHARETFANGCLQASHEFVERRSNEAREILDAKSGSLERGFGQHILDLRRDTAHQLIERINSAIRGLL